MRKFIYIICTIVVVSGGIAKAQIDADRMTIIGRNALYFEDYILAIQYFNQIIKAKPYLSEPYFYRAVGKYHLEDYKGALNDCNEAIERNPYLVDAYNLRGILYQKMEKPEVSIKDFKRGLEVENRNTNLLINLGIAYIQTEQYDSAIHVYSQVLEMSPNLASGYLNRGLAKFSANDTVGAVKDFTRAIDTNPYIPDGLVNRAMVYYHQGEFEDALDDLEKAIQIKPEEPSLYMNRGIIRYQLDDLRGALNDFNEFVSMKPRSAMAYNNRGILRAEIGDLEGAIDDLSRVLALRGEDLPTLFYRGMLYKDKGEFRKALSDFNVVANAHPDFAPVYMNRAEVHQSLGQEQAANLDYNTAMTIEMDRRNQIGQTHAADDKTDQKQEEKPERKETRKQDDRNINNYNKIAVLDDFGAEQPEHLTGSTLRGKIQNRNIIIDMQPPYGLTFFPGDTLIHRVRYFERDVEQLSNSFAFESSLEISNKTREIDRSASAAVFERISEVDNQMEQPLPSDQKVNLYLERSFLYMGVWNLNNAINDFDQALKLDSTKYMAYFGRAFARYKMVETVKEMEAQNMPDEGQLDLIGAGEPRNDRDIDNQKTMLDYNLIIADLEEIVRLEPEFEFAWYDLGYMHSVLRNFEEAVEAYTKAIEVNPDFAEAWYNRGLIRLFLNQTEKGTHDLGKAGELGVFEAYSVIKRYGSHIISTPPVKEEDMNE